jgi:NTE family protein
MKAYAILDGGGVKGAALAGCLKAAEEQGVEFLGYGGTSAGSIIAYLAVLGYSGEDLRRVMTKQIQFKQFLDDAGVSLDRLKCLPEKLKGRRWSTLWVLWKHRDLIHKLVRDFGLYNAKQLQKFLLEMAINKIPALKGQSDISFNDLLKNGRPPLKIVVSDIRSRELKVYSGLGGDEVNGSVIDAVRASMSYPFVFLPVQMNNRYLVDGGLTSNLPIFLFEKERRSDGVPVIAFDLESTARQAEEQYGLKTFCGDMLATALESADRIQRQLVQGVHHVRIPIPAGIDTLDFNLTESQCEALFTSGQAATHSFFCQIVPQWAQAKNQVEALQALHIPSKLIQPVLRAVVKDFEDQTPARAVRCSIMLPTGNGTRIVVYQFGMDNDPDVDIELSMDGGCSGAAWSGRRPSIADLNEAKANFAGRWKMTREQQNRVRPDRQAMYSFPIFDLRASRQLLKMEELELLGVLSVDTSTSLNDTRWLESEPASQIGKNWADVVARIIK